jgi:hypothetical protein
MNRHWVLHRHNTHLPRTMGPLPAMLRPFPSVRQRTDRVRRSVTTSSQITRMTTVQVVSDRSVSFSPPSAESQPLRASPEILDARLIDDIHGPPHNAHARFPEFIERREYAAPLRSGLTVTMRSTSLSGRAVPRATEPTTRTC